MHKILKISDVYSMLINVINVNIIIIINYNLFDTFIVFWYPF